MPEGRYVTRWEEFQLLPGVIEAIDRLNAARVRVIVVSNQRGIAKGLYSADNVRAIHEKFQATLAAFGARVDGFYFCPHDKNECDCRKPMPGLFQQAQVEFPAISTPNSAMIGDSKSDMEFGRRLGMYTVFVECDPKHQKPGADQAREIADMQTATLLDAVNALLFAQEEALRVKSTMCLGFPAK
jgi:D-glycero-D-manno-heptose 1,7-bisphosphate phosphatase